MLTAGVAIIDQVVFHLNQRILELEANEVVAVIDDYHKTLEDSGLSSLAGFRKSLEEELAVKFKEFHFGHSGVIFIRTPTGAVITNADPRSAPWDMIAAKGGADGVFEYLEGASGHMRMGVYKKSKNAWQIVITLEKSEIFEKRDQYFRLVILASIAILLIALGAAYYFGKRLSDQINAILATVKRVAKGDLFARIDLKPLCDEHRELQDGINSMIDNIRLRDLERERAEEEARKHQKLESIGVLAGGIAHDFNNLLTAIRGNLQLAQMLDNSPETQQCLSDCEKASVRAMELTKQLLTFSKGGAPIKSTASIKEIIENNATFVLRGTKTKCEFEFDADLKPVDIDVGQIGQAIDNIVINANQAMPNGGIIRIRAENIKLSGKSPIPLPPGDYVKISIADQGQGIPKANISKIFDPFFTTKPQGSGLGLSTTYNILKRHGGHVTVDSEAGIGTIFFIYLPASTGSVKDNSAAEGEKYSGGGRVLIMDDQESIRKLLSKMLSIMNCDCDSAEDGERAIAKYIGSKESGKPFDVVFMDLTIPGGMGGKDTMAALMKVDPEITAVVASGYSNDPIMANFSDYGFKGRLDKPFKMQDLAKLMNSLMKSRGSKQKATAPLNSKQSAP